MSTKSPNSIDRHVGSRVRMRRMLIGMSQEKLGQTLGVTFQQVQKYEKGTNRIGASRLQHIANVLGVSVDFLFEGAPRLEGPAGEDAAGFAEAPPSEYVADFLSTPEGVQLMKHFVRIANPRVRRRVVDLVAALAGEEND
jgi:transcriptional regulator with XRE-family HTH domain